MVGGVGPGHRTNLKTLISNYKDKQELSHLDFFNFLDSCAKPSNTAGIRGY